MMRTKSTVWAMCIVSVVLSGLLQRSALGADPGSPVPSSARHKASSAQTGARSGAGNGNGNGNTPAGYTCSSYATTCKACTILSCVCSAAPCETGYYDAGGTHFTYNTNDPNSLSSAAQRAVAKCCK